jgi:chemosensory pili system protein ChpA (sensor histidine kinase/response regulator)
LRLEAGQLERLGNQQILRVAGKVLPAVRLDTMLGGKARAEDESDELNPRQPVLVVDTGGEQAALLVDSLIVAREVVVKTLGSLVRKVRGVTGATILGDGGIVLIVNTSELFDTHTAGQEKAARPATAWVRQQRRAGLEVLVVDDSVSVRRVLTNLLRNQGWTTEAARDGMEALELIQSGRKFDAVLLDMEMPRMDGYELLALLRSQPQFATLPIVMLTSRAAEKHRSKAFELGVTEFLVKPYQDEALVAVINRVVAGREALAG